MTKAGYSDCKYCVPYIGAPGGHTCTDHGEGVCCTENRPLPPGGWNKPWTQEQIAALDKALTTLLAHPNTTPSTK
jgi:hypothetical protein